MDLDGRCRLKFEEEVKYGFLWYFHYCNAAKAL